MTLAISIIGAVLAIVFANVRKAFLQTGKGYIGGHKVSSHHHRNINFISNHKKQANVLYWAVILVLLTISFTLISAELGLLVQMLFVSVILFSVFILVPIIKVGKYTAKISESLSQITRILIVKLQPLGRLLSNVTGRLLSPSNDTGVYSESDLRRLLELQVNAQGNSIDEALLDKLQSIIDTHMKKAEDLMLAMKYTKKLGSSETIGPVIIDELHQTGQKYFPVEEEFNNEIIGIVKMADLTALKKKSGTMKDIAVSELNYIDKSSTLEDCLNEYVETGSSVLLVKGENKHKPLGLIAIEDILNNIFKLENKSQPESQDKAESSE